MFDNDTLQAIAASKEEAKVNKPAELERLRKQLKDEAKETVLKYKK